MGITSLLLIITKVAELTDSAWVQSENILQLSKLHRQWCVPQNDWCRNRYKPEDPLDYQCGAQHAALTNASACCGFCSCERDCLQYGSCCLSEYRNLNYGKNMLEKASAKYSCVKPQLLMTESETDFSIPNQYSVWMVSKCPSNNMDEQTRVSCENPGTDASLDDIAPVTDHDTHYRNKYCALCNGLVDVDSWPRWTLELYCMRYIKINGNNILQRILENRCNIFFIPPDSVRHPRKCIPQSYKISRCNETGLWTSYNKTIERACNAYVDTFNGTYKNIFCYWCNTNTLYEGCLVNLSTCVSTRSEVTSPTPLFTMILDRNALEETDSANECDHATQFYDDKLDVCQIIMCDFHRQLHDHRCILNVNTDEPLCYVMYVKLTPEKPGTLNAQMIWHEMPARVDGIFKEEGTKLLVFAIYYQTWTTSTEYVVMEISVQTDGFGVDILSLMLLKFHNKIHHISENLTVLSEFVMANRVPVNDSNFPIQKPYFLSIWDNTSELDETVYGEVHTTNLNDRKLCNKTEPILLDRLHVCPYITLNYKETEFEEDNNNSLKIHGRFGRIIIPRWEYRIGNKSIAMCLSTYREIYKSIAGYAASSTMFIQRSLDAARVKYIYLPVVTIIHTTILK